MISTVAWSGLLHGHGQFGGDPKSDLARGGERRRGGEEEGEGGKL